jgi:hypothetical protein
MCQVPTYVILEDFIFLLERSVLDCFIDDGMMMYQLIQDQGDVAAYEEEKLMVISCGFFSVVVGRS